MFDSRRSVIMLSVVKLNVTASLDWAAAGAKKIAIGVQIGIKNSNNFQEVFNLSGFHAFF
jgi:hypothetical protein